MMSLSNLNKTKLMQPFFENGRFYNCIQDKSRSFFKKSFLGLLKTLLSFDNTSQEKLISWISSDNSYINNNNSITWLGHSSFLIRIGEINIITDPIFWDINLFFKRILPMGANLYLLPKIDFVIISHNHYDHLDERSIKYLYDMFDPIFLIPKGDKKWFEKRKMAEKVKDFTWWQTFQDDSKIRFSFLPSVHWSQRGLFDYNKSLWGSWMIEFDSINIYFGGDTAFGEHFSQISSEFSKIDLALMPIGPCEPRKAMENAHISAEEACKAFQLLKARKFIPMHWGTFKLGIDKFEEPINRIVKSFCLDEKLKEQLIILKSGQTLDIKSLDLEFEKIHLNIEKANEVSQKFL